MPSSISKTYRKQAVVENASYVTVQTLPWMLAFGESTLRTTLELRALAGNFGGRVGFRSADVRTTQRVRFMTRSEQALEWASGKASYS
jgi:hypothetical protein